MYNMYTINIIEKRVSSPVEISALMPDVFLVFLSGRNSKNFSYDYVGHLITQLIV